MMKNFLLNSSFFFDICSIDRMKPFYLKNTKIVIINLGTCAIITKIFKILLQLGSLLVISYIKACFFNQIDYNLTQSNFVSPSVVFLESMENNIVLFTLVR